MVAEWKADAAAPGQQRADLHQRNERDGVFGSAETQVERPVSVGLAENAGPGRAMEDGSITMRLNGLIPLWVAQRVDDGSLEAGTAFVASCRNNERQGPKRRCSCSDASFFER